MVVILEERIPGPQSPSILHLSRRAAFGQVGPELHSSGVVVNNKMVQSVTTPMNG